MNDDPRAGRWRRAAIGVLVGASAWLSAGTLAVIDASALTRLGALPDLRWLAGGGGGWGRRRRPGAAAGSGSWRRCRCSRCCGCRGCPLPVPAAFLLWEGPLEAAVWTIAIGGLLWRRPAPASARRRCAGWRRPGRR